MSLRSFRQSRYGVASDGISVRHCGAEEIKWLEKKMLGYLGPCWGAKLGRLPAGIRPKDIVLALFDVHAEISA